MNNNRDLSKILESLQDLQENTASTEEITVLKEILSEIISTVIVLAQQTVVLSTENRNSIDQIYKYLTERDTLGGRYLEIKKEKKNVNS